MASGSPDAGFTLGAQRRGKHVTTIPGTVTRYWLICMRGDAYFVTSNEAGHLKCHGCRDQSCGCADCTESREAVTGRTM